MRNQPELFFRGACLRKQEGLEGRQESVSHADGRREKAPNIRAGRKPTERIPSREERPVLLVDQGKASEDEFDALRRANYV